MRNDSGVSLKRVMLSEYTAENDDLYTIFQKAFPFVYLVIIT